GVAEPSGLWRICRQLAPINPNRAVIPTPFKDLEDAVGQHDEFRAVVVLEGAGIPERIAVHHGVLPAFAAVGCRDAGVVHLSLSGFPQFLAVLRERGLRLEVERDSIVSPDAGEVFGIERMALHFVSIFGRLDVAVILAPRTGLPAWTGRHFLHFKSGFLSD